MSDKAIIQKHIDIWKGLELGDSGSEFEYWSDLKDSFLKKLENRWLAGYLAGTMGCCNDETEEEYTITYTLAHSPDKFWTENK